MTAGRSHSCRGRGGAGIDHGNVIIVGGESCGGGEMVVVTGERGGGKGDRAPESEQHYWSWSGASGLTVSTLVGGL